MEHTILETVGKIAGLGGLALGVFLLLFRDVIRKNIFPNLTRSQAFRLLMLVLVLVWSVALAGIAAWVYVTVSNSGSSGPTELETSLSELVPLLELRAQQITSQLREFATRISDEGLKSLIDDTIRNFSTLHEQNIEALRQGQLIRSHELTRECRRVLARTAALLIQFGGDPTRYYDATQGVSDRAAGDGEQFAIRYSNVEYMRDLRQIEGHFSNDEFVDKELVAVLNYRARIIFKQLETIPDVGGELKEKFLRLHKENLDWLKGYSSLESQGAIYRIEQLLKKAKALTENPEQLIYDPGYYADSEIQ